MRGIPDRDRIPQTWRKLHAIASCCAPIEAVSHSKESGRLATEVGCSIRSPDAPQTTRGNDENGTAAFPPTPERFTPCAAAFRFPGSCRPLAEHPLMEHPALLRQQLIARLVAQQPEHIADDAMGHWQKLADEIISIVGEAGFNSLYERSLHLAQSAFPWLPPCPSPSPTPHRFAELGARLADQTTDHARAANSLLLTTFTDILASLIGEQLTASILRSAWGDPASFKAGKELDNE